MFGFIQKFFYSWSDKFSLFALFIGYSIIVLTAYRVIRYALGVFVCKVHLEPYRKPGSQSWALITGGTDGIGLGFAQELLQAGFNVIITGRNPEKLLCVKGELKKSFPKLQIEAIENHADDISSGNIDALIRVCNNKDLSILVNNVGMGTNKRAPLTEQDPDIIRTLVNVNCTYPTLVTHALIPLMTSRNLGHKLAIINVASVAGRLPGPFNQVYSASKAYNHVFSTSLGLEFPSIDVISVCPGFVATNMTRMKETPLVCSGRECARLSLQRLSTTDSILPHPVHAVMFYFIKILTDLTPVWLASWLLRVIMPQIRQALRKFDD